MIQRIQSVYLLGVSLLAILILTGKFAQFEANGKLYALTATGINTLETTTNFAPVFSISILSFSMLLLVFPLINIFLYKNRKNQIKMGNLIMVLAIGVFLSIMYYLIFIESLIPNTGEVIAEYKVSIIWPLIALVLAFLANNSIKKDEALIKSMDRLR